MKLWLDVGNTRLKWQLFDGSSLIDQGYVVHSGDMKSAMYTLAQFIKSSCSCTKISFAGLASVLNKDALDELSAACQNMLGLDLQKAEVSRELKGVVCAYKDVSRLGVDRWLALVAAFHQKKAAVCVIDCGSALTIDMVNNAGEHLGGFILPGLNMSAKALLGQTHSVRFDELASEVASLSLGRDTASAVLNGVLLQAQASIKEAWQIFQSECLSTGENGYLFITGGDALTVINGLKLDFEMQDDLVIQGLRLALE